MITRQKENSTSPRGRQGPDGEVLPRCFPPVLPGLYSAGAIAGAGADDMLRQIDGMVGMEVHGNATWRLVGVSFHFISRLICL